MRYHPRAVLPERVHIQLAAWQRALDVELAEEAQKPLGERRPPGETADQHWVAHRQTLTLEAVTVALTAMASPDVARCMYCEHDRGHEIDHAVPKSRDASRTFDWDNHLWACGSCNRQKLSRYHVDMLVPTVDDPLAHLDLTPSGLWAARPDSPRGRATMETLPLLNHQALVVARRRCRARLLDTWTALAREDAPSPEAIEHFRQTVTQEPFSDVFASLLSLCRLPNAAVFVDAAVLRFVGAHPELYDWLPTADAERLRDAAPEIERRAKAMRPRGGIRQLP